MTLPPLNTSSQQDHQPCQYSRVRLGDALSIMLNLPNFFFLNNQEREGDSVDTNEKVKSLINLGQWRQR